MKLLKFVSAGLSIGFVFTTFFCLLFIGFNEITTQILAWFFASVFYGLFTLIFEIKTLKLMHASLLHYGLCLTVTGVNIYLFYRDYLGSVLLSFTLSYLVIYLVMWQVEKQKIKKLNLKLREKL